MENTTLKLSDTIVEVAVTFEGLTYDLLPAALPILLVIFLLYEDIFPKQLTGPGPNGEQITLPVCQQTGREPILSFPNTNDPILPNLDRCVNYMSARGWDRIVDLYAQIFGTIPLQDERAKRRDKEFCGQVGSVQYCFPPCVNGFDGSITRSVGQISCFVYNHGDPSDTIVNFNEMVAFFNPYSVGPSTPIDLEIPLKICGRLRNLGTSALYCVPLCERHPFNPTSTVRISNIYYAFR